MLYIGLDQASDVADSAGEQRALAGSSDLSELGPVLDPAMRDPRLSMCERCRTANRMTCRCHPRTNHRSNGQVATFLVTVLLPLLLLAGAPRADRSRVGRRVLPADIPPGVIRTKAGARFPGRVGARTSHGRTFCEVSGLTNQILPASDLLARLVERAGTESAYPCAGTRPPARRCASRRCRWARYRASPPRPSG